MFAKLSRTETTWQTGLTIELKEFGVISRIPNILVELCSVPT